MEDIISNKRRYYSKIAGIAILCMVISNALFAHTVVGELEKMSGKDAAILYLELGYTHILPLGLDHILFVLSLYLLSPKLKPVLYQAPVFTVAHSVTLGLSMYHVIKPPANIVEPVIAFSRPNQPRFDAHERPCRAAGGSGQRRDSQVSWDPLLDQAEQPGAFNQHVGEVAAESFERLAHARDELRAGAAPAPASNPSLP